MRSSKLFLFAAAFAATACASAPKGSSNSASTVITADQIATANVPTAYDAVDRLHRSWWRDLANPGEVVVYMNNQKLEGGKEALRQIPASDVEQLEYLKSADAVMRFGQDAKSGAIIVTRK